MKSFPHTVESGRDSFKLDPNAQSDAVSPFEPMFTAAQEVEGWRGFLRRREKLPVVNICILHVSVKSESARRERRGRTACEPRAAQVLTVCRACGPFSGAVCAVWVCHELQAGLLACGELISVGKDLPLTNTGSGPALSHSLSLSLFCSSYTCSLRLPSPHPAPAPHL